MAWTTPTNPVAGTVITVAYAITNFINNLNWLRGLTGNTDPPGSNYTIRSTSTTATDWSKVTVDMLDVNAVINEKILDRSIDASTKLAEGSVTDFEIATGTINGDNTLIASSITGNGAGSAIGTNAINFNRMNASLTSSEFTRVTGSAAVVATANIIDLNVTTGKLAAGAVTHDKMTVVAPLSSIQGPPLTLTTSNGDLAQITAAVAGLYLVHAHVVLYTTTTAGDTNQNLQSWIAAPSGTVGTLFRHYTGATAVDQNAVQAQSALIQLTVGQQVTLRAKKSGGTGNSGANDGTLIAVRISA